jgi:hypothetical protein
MYETVRVNARLVCDTYTCAKIARYKPDEACTTAKFEDIQILEGISTAGDVAR